MDCFDSPDKAYMVKYDNLIEMRIGLLVGDITIFEVCTETQLMHFKQVVFDSSPWSSPSIIVVPIRFYDGSWFYLHIDVLNTKFAESKNNITNSINLTDWQLYETNS